MIYRINCTKDNFSSNKSESGNAGHSPLLKIGKQTDSNTGDTWIWRSYFYFDINAIKGYQNSGSIPWDTSSMNFQLKAFDCYFSGSYPESFDLLVYPISSGWDEGGGIEFDLSVSGVMNWTNRISTTTWSNSGGDYSSNLSASQHFDSGSEDLNVDISNIVYQWLDGTLANNGLILLLSSSQETSGSGTDNYDQKLFYSRHTITNWEPVLEMRWDDCIKDDGNTEVLFTPLYASYQNYFYLYNSIAGTMMNFPGTPTGSSIDLIFTLYSSSMSGTSSVSTSIASTTASWKEIGIYEAGPITASGNGIPSGTILTGSWESVAGNFEIDQYFSITSASEVFDRITINPPGFVFNLSNLKQQYFLSEKQIIDVYGRDKYPSYSFGSGNQDLDSEIFRHLYYEIRDAKTNETIIPYDTTYTRCSYGGGGNYFKIWMDSFKRGKMYKIILVNQENQETNFVDGNFIFRVI